MSNRVQAITIAMFGAAAGGYTAELEASVEASGLAAVANSIMGLQQPLLGLDLSDNAVWTDLVLANLGITDTNAAYGTAAAYFAARFEAGASRGDIVAEAVAYLGGTAVSAEFTAIAEAFVAQVETAEEWSLGDGAEILGITDLRGAVGNDAAPGVFNLTAALATLEAADSALEDFLTNLDLDEDGEADTDVPGTADNNLDLALIAALATADGKIDGNYTGANDVTRAALLTAQQASNAADLTGANALLDAAQADIDAVDGLQDLIDAYEAADAANDAAEAALLTAQSNTAAAEAYLLTQLADGDDTLTRNADGTYSYDADGAGVVFAAVDIITLNDDDALVLGTDVTDEDYAGVTALLAASIAQEAAEVVDTDANTALIEAGEDLDAVDDGEYSVFLSAENDVEAAQDAIDALADAMAALAALDALDDERTDLETALADAEDAISEAGYDLENAEIGDQLEVYTAKGQDGEDVTLGAGDVLVLSGFTYNNGDVEADGNNSTLEFFLTETLGGDVVVSFEESVFGSNAEVAELMEVTLVGVTIDELMIGSNYLQLA